MILLLCLFIRGVTTHNESTLLVVEDASTRLTVQNVATPLMLGDASTSPIGQEVSTPLNIIMPSPPPNDCRGFPQPPPASLEYWHEKCSNDSECIGNPYAMTCQDGLCECTEDYEPNPNRAIGTFPTKRTCVSLPVLFNKCKDKCHRPAQCLSFNNDPDKVCQCADPFVFIQGNCILECDDTEIYDQKQYKCVTRCKADEVKINDTCQPMVDLGQKCDSDKQCQALFAECSNGTCGCRSGFKVNGTLCSPQEYVCPIGEALKNPNGVQFCRTFFGERNQTSSGQVDSTLPQRPPQKLKDNCPQGYFCLISGADIAQDNQHGFCCPYVAKECPMGLPHPTLKCGTSKPGVQYCPLENHYCHNIQFGNFHKEVCCPKPCSPEEVQVGDDKCLPLVRLDGYCLINEQCTDSYAECINGTCQCENGADKSDSLFPICLKQCPFDEVLQNKQCVKRKKLNDTCSPSDSYLCPVNAFCNGENRCVCECEMFLLAPNVCAPKSSCPFISEPVPQHSHAPTLLPRKHLVCRVRNLDPPPGVNITQCPEDQYCTYYMSHLGQCCQKPPRVCPIRRQPPEDDRNCDPRNPLSCGTLEELCTKYVSPVDEDPNSRNNTICCAKYTSTTYRID